QQPPPHPPRKRGEGEQASCPPYRHTDAMRPMWFIAINQEGLPKMLTRRRFTQGSAALAAAAILPRTATAQEPQAEAPAATPQAARYVRRSIGDLIRDNSPLIESYKRGVDVMMQRPITDKTSWLFQAAIHDIADEQITDELKPLMRYWQQCPHG